jgi:hypothetical protein
MLPNANSVILIAHVLHTVRTEQRLTPGLWPLGQLSPDPVFFWQLSMKALFFFAFPLRSNDILSVGVSNPELYFLKVWLKLNLMYCSCAGVISTLCSPWWRSCWNAVTQGFSEFLLHFLFIDYYHNCYF